MTAWQHEYVGQKETKNNVTTPNCGGTVVVYEILRIWWHVCWVWWHVLPQCGSFYWSGRKVDLKNCSNLASVACDWLNYNWDQSHSLFPSQPNRVQEKLIKVHDCINYNLKTPESLSHKQNFRWATNLNSFFYFGLVRELWMCSWPWLPEVDGERCHEQKFMTLLFLWPFTNSSFLWMFSIVSCYFSWFEWSCCLVSCLWACWLLNMGCLMAKLWGKLVESDFHNFSQ